MKYYCVEDLEKMDFMGDTYYNPMTLNELRKRFWDLDESDISYSLFTRDFIEEQWNVIFIEVKNISID